ncbi:MAG TPA: hypothetical protein VKG45_10740 [Actinomycetes bacterium]|nr:hypothetical protein [Actinomycetes bacterium]
MTTTGGTSTRPPRAPGPTGQQARVVYSPPGPRALVPPLAPRALAVLGALLVVFLMGAIAGRATVRTGATPAPAAPARERQQPPATEAAGRPDQAGAQDTGPLAAEGAGPARVANGVPVGYARTRAGAIAAATNYVAVLSDERSLDAGWRDQAIQIIAAPDAAAALRRSAATNATLLSRVLRLPAKPDGVAVLLRVIPVGARVERYDENSATVSIWQTSLGGSTNGAPVQQAWGTTRVTLRWVGDDWKQVSASTAVGPTPLADDALPTAASELIAKTRDFEEYRYAPGS